MKPTLIIFLLLMSTSLDVMAQLNNDDVLPQVLVGNGALQGTMSSGIRVFRGIPFAQPPVGDLRWTAPKPMQNWDGVRKADKFGPRCMQHHFFDDMIFFSDGMGEDCLYLNVWTPARPEEERLPVLVYFYGGGLFTGDGSENRYNGESMAREGIVTITVNYRLSIFGFFAHPELTEEADYHASGNYGFLDQTAALQWIHDNITAFGGDPDRVTIAGESAGSVSVSAQMVSPLSKDLIAGAIGSSGSLMGTLRAAPQAAAEEKGVGFGKDVGATTLDKLRAIPADELLEATSNYSPAQFSPAIDGYFFPEKPEETFLAGRQAKVPLLLGWNSLEGSYQRMFRQKEPTPENYLAVLKSQYGENAERVLAVYPGGSKEEVMQSATDLSGDQFTGFSTWKWADLHVKTGEGQPVYRYFYARPRPETRDPDDQSMPASGAVHSAEIEYAMGNLSTNRVYNWMPEDYRVSAIFKAYYANFVKTGNPNGHGVPEWPMFKGGDDAPVMYIDAKTRVEPAKQEERYRVLDAVRADINIF